MSREVHARFWERAGVKFLRATRHVLPFPAQKNEGPPSPKAVVHQRAAAIYSLINTAKLNGVDPQTWLADVLRRISDHPAKRID